VAGGDAFSIIKSELTRTIQKGCSLGGGGDEGSDLERKGVSEQKKLLDKKIRREQVLKKPPSNRQGGRLKSATGVCQGGLSGSAILEL